MTCARCIHNGISFCSCVECRLEFDKWSCVAIHYNRKHNTITEIRERQNRLK